MKTKDTTCSHWAALHTVPKRDPTTGNRITGIQIDRSGFKSAIAQIYTFWDRQSGGANAEKSASGPFWYDATDRPNPLLAYRCQHGRRSKYHPGASTKTLYGYDGFNKQQYLRPLLPVYNETLFGR